MNNKKAMLPKRVLSTKNIAHCLQNDRKTLSAIKVNRNNVAKPKKTTKSDINFEKHKQITSRRQLVTDDKKNSGDCAKNTRTKLLTNTEQITANNLQNKCETVKDLYKNKNFIESSDSININSPKKNPLDTIKELPEARSETTIYSNVTIDSDDEILENIKTFRRQNYFECHSAKSRMQAAIRNDSNHECSYSFFLNERLFPIPIKSDYNNSLRCTECCLPFNNRNEGINGTIQAKVRLGKEDPKDIVVLLPVKDNLIIKEKRKEKVKVQDEDVAYFGIVKLKNNNTSLFYNNAHGDSFALRYEKGFTCYGNHFDCNYIEVDKSDIIIV